MEHNCFFRSGFGYTTTRDEPAFVEESFLSRLDEIYQTTPVVMVPVHRLQTCPITSGILDLGRYHVEISKVENRTDPKNLIVGKLLNNEIQIGLLNTSYSLTCYPVYDGVTHPAEEKLKAVLHGSDTQIFECVKNSKSPSDFITIISRLKIRDSLFYKLVEWGLSSQNHGTRDSVLSLIEGSFVDERVKKALEEACGKERVSFLKENMKLIISYERELSK